MLRESLIIRVSISVIQNCAKPENKGNLASATTPTSTGKGNEKKKAMEIKIASEENVKKVKTNKTRNYNQTKDDEKNEKKT